MENQDNLYNQCTRHLKPPNFKAGKDCIRMFMGRFEIWRDIFNQRWTNAFTMNILSSCVCDKTLLVLTSFPQIIRESYELSKQSLISHFDAGVPDNILFDKLNSCRQQVDQTVIEYFNNLLFLNKALQVPPEIFKHIFVAGLRIEIRNYLGVHFNENMSLRQGFYLAKKFETVSKSFESFGENWNQNNFIDKFSPSKLQEDGPDNFSNFTNNWRDKLPRYKVFGEYPSRYKDNNYTSNNLDQGIGNENDTGNYYKFTGGKTEIFQSQNERVAHRYNIQPRCAVVQTNLIKNAKSSCSDDYNSFTSLGRRRIRMVNNKNAVLNKDRKVSDFRCQNSNFPQFKRPCVSVVTINSDKLEEASRGKYMSTGGFLSEDIELKPKEITKTFIYGEVPKMSKIKIEGNLFARSKLVVVFEKEGVSPTLGGYLCEISNLNGYSIQLAKNTEIANIRYLQTNSQNDLIGNEKTGILNPNIQEKVDARSFRGVIDDSWKKLLKKAAQIDRENAALIDQEGGISTPMLPNINCVEKVKVKNINDQGISGSSNKLDMHSFIVSPAKSNDKVGSDNLNKLNHRRKVFEEIKLFFKFKEIEDYVNVLKAQIEEIRLKSDTEFEDFALKFKNLEQKIYMNNLGSSVSNISDNLYKDNSQAHVFVSSMKNDNGFAHFEKENQVNFSNTANAAQIIPNGDPIFTTDESVIRSTVNKKFSRCENHISTGNFCYNCGNKTLRSNDTLKTRKENKMIPKSDNTVAYTESDSCDQRKKPSLGKKYIFVNPNENADINSPDKHFSKEQDIFIGPNLTETAEIHKNINKTYPSDQDIENIGNLKVMKLIQPDFKLSLNGSRIFLPPVAVTEYLGKDKIEIDNNMNANKMESSIGSTKVSDFPTVSNVMRKISEIRNFINKSLGERKILVENILNSHE